MEETIMNKKLRSMLALLLCLCMVVSMLAVLTGCPDKKKESDAVTYNTTTTVMPSNWNEFTYADNNDTQIMSYIGSSFFEYDYKFENDKKYNEDGSINKDGIVPGAYTTNYSAATKLEDVTSSVDAKWRSEALPISNGTDDTLSAVSTDGGGDGSFPGKSGIFLGYAELFVCKENRIDPLGDQACCVFV